MSIEDGHSTARPLVMDIISEKDVRIKGMRTAELSGSVEPGQLARDARKLAQAALETMRTDEMLAFVAATIISEIAANAIKYGGMLTELDIVRLPSKKKKRHHPARPETVYTVAVNPALESTIDETPGTVHRGELAADEPNDEAEHGRGLLMVDTYTNHNWGQRRADGEIITYAVITTRTIAMDDFDAA
jgi:hypothetical protein